VRRQSLRGSRIPSVKVTKDASLARPPSGGQIRFAPPADTGGSIRFATSLPACRPAIPALCYDAPVPGGPGQSAAQNGPLFQHCPECNSLNGEHATECYSCRAPLAADAEPQPVAVGTSESDWRSEVAQRLEAYRARRRGIAPDAAQNPFPFAEETLDGNEESGAEPAARPRCAGRSRPAVTPASIAIEIEQPRLDFSEADSADERPASSFHPVAEVRERVRAGALDALFIALAYAGFLGLFLWLGGEIALGKVPAAICGAALLLLYGLYLGFFTFFAGATPGMHLRGLYVVSFDGSAPNDRQLLWRSFGYLLSAGTLGMGFLWSLWDEDTLTWQDRISQTYLTSDVAAETAEQMAGK
jgi:uncharacterized RDD family membrane protein YckC